MNLALLPVLQTLQDCVKTVTFGFLSKHGLKICDFVVPKSKFVFHIVGVKRACEIANEKAKC